MKEHGKNGQRPFNRLCVMAWEASQALLALTSPTYPRGPFSAQPWVCQATDPAEADPSHGLVARPALGPAPQPPLGPTAQPGPGSPACPGPGPWLALDPAPRPASLLSAVAPLLSFHFCMSLTSDGGTVLFLPDLIFFPYKAQTFRVGYLTACSVQIFLNGAF